MHSTIGTVFDLGVDKIGRELSAEYLNGSFRYFDRQLMISFLGIGGIMGGDHDIVQG
jgi:hypothetical protein